MNSLKAFVTLFIESSKFPLTRSERIRVFWNLAVLHLKSKFSQPSTNEIQQRLHGFLVYAYDYPSLINLYTEIFLKQVYVVRAKRHQPLIIDCGANIGMSILFFKQLYPESIIWAFEPNPNSFYLLKKNVEHNQLQSVKLFNCALSSTNGQTTFFVPSHKGSLNGSSRAGLDSYETTIEARKLSDFVKDTKIDFLKIDIEGDEVSVVKDLIVHNSMTFINELIIEYHQEISPMRLHDFLNYFKDANFSYEVVAEDTHRNVILHFFRESNFLEMK